jgi:hypothetical protein
MARSKPSREDVVGGGDSWSALLSSVSGNTMVTAGDISSS